MIEVLAVRDQQRGVLAEQFPITPDVDPAKLVAAQRAQYPAPRYETVLLMAADAAALRTVYPPFADAAVDQPEGDDDGDSTTVSGQVRGGAAARGGDRDG